MENLNYYKMLLPDIGRNMLISLVKVDKANVLHDDAHYQHSDESWQGGDLQHEPSSEVGAQGQHGEGEHLATGRGRVAHYNPHRHPYQYS